MKRSYIVDLGYTMLRPERMNPTTGVDNQELFCKCGTRYKYKGKVKKEVVIHSGPIQYDKFSLDSIVCPNCHEKYDLSNTPHLLEPDLQKIVECNYFRKTFIDSKNQQISSLIRERKYALFRREDSTLKEISIYDQLSFNHETRKSILFINNSVFPDENLAQIEPENDSLNSINSDEKIRENNFFEKNISVTIAAGNLFKLKQFFGHILDVQYVNLEEAFLYFKELSKFVPDFDEMSNLPFISSIWDSYHIFSEKINLGGVEKIIEYRLVDDEFSFSEEKVKEEFQPGIYLNCLSSIADLFLAVTSYSNLTTLYLTKGYVFFEEFIKSKLCAFTNVLNYHSATYPNKIIEVAMNYNQAGALKPNKEDVKLPLDSYKGKESKSQITNNLLKISNVICNSIKYPKDIEVVKNFYDKSYLNKTELEILLNKYDDSEVFPVLGFLGQSSSKSDVLSFRHIEHIIRYKLYENYSTDFLNSYLDTIRTINSIIDTQGKVKEYIKKRGTSLSAMEKEALKGYLDVKPSLLFEAKNSRALKRLHDNMSVLYSTFQDATKVARYAEAVEKRLNMNRIINYISLEVIPSAIELQREHQVMHHCINTYLDRIGRGEYLAVRCVDIISNEQATLGLVINNKSITFDQLKAFWNSRATPHIISAVQEFCKIHKIDERVGTTRDLTVDNSSVRRTEDCLEPKDSMNIRMLLEEEQKNNNDKPLEMQKVYEIIKEYKTKHFINI